MQRNAMQRNAMQCHVGRALATDLGVAEDVPVEAQVIYCIELYLKLYIQLYIQLCIKFYITLNV